MDYNKKLGARKTWPSWPLIFLCIISFFPSFFSVYASNFYSARKASVLSVWKKEMKFSYPTPEVLLATRYFIRDVLAENQQFVMTNDGAYWNTVRTKYGGNPSKLINHPLEHLYDFNWYIFNDLKKYREASVNNSKEFFTDYLAIVDLFCDKLSDSIKIKSFFETYFTDWLISVTYNRDNVPRLKPVIREAIRDLPKDFQSLEKILDSLENILPAPEKNRSRIDSLIAFANNSFLKKYKCYLTFNLFSGKKTAGLINAFWIEDDFKYPVKIDKDTIDLNVQKLRCIDNLNQSIAVPGYYYRKQVYIFPENQPFAWIDFEAYFNGKRPFPITDLFVCDTTIRSYYDNGVVSESCYNDLMTYFTWLKNGDGKTFVSAINTLSKPSNSLSYVEWVKKLEISLLLHEVVGHGGTFCNKVITEPTLATFEYHVDAEFYAHILQYLYSPIQGFDLACMFSHMSDPVYFSHQYGEAYLKICKELIISIDKNNAFSIRFKNWSKTHGDLSIVHLLDSFKAFETLSYQNRIQYCLFPLVSFLNELTQEDRTLLFRYIYFRNTDKAIPEPIIATARPKQ